MCVLYMSAMCYQCVMHYIMHSTGYEPVLVCVRYHTKRGSSLRLGEGVGCQGWDQFRCLTLNAINCPIHGGVALWHLVPEQLLLHLLGKIRL